MLPRLRMSSQLAGGMRNRCTSLLRTQLDSCVLNGLGDMVDQKILAKVVCPSSSDASYLVNSCIVAKLGQAHRQSKRPAYLFPCVSTRKVPDRTDGLLRHLEGYAPCMRSYLVPPTSASVSSRASHARTDGKVIKATFSIKTSQSIDEASVPFHHVHADSSLVDL